jgi:hypothetical protein
MCIPNEAKRLAHASVSQMFRRKHSSCRINSLSSSLRLEYDNMTKEQIVTKETKLLEGNWWPTSMIAWLFHGIPCTEVTNRCIKISHAREILPTVPSDNNKTKEFVQSVKKQRTDKEYEGRAMKRAKARQDNELLQNNKNAKENIVIHNHNIIKKLSIDEMRSQLLSYSDNMISTYESIENCTMPKIKELLLKKYQLLETSYNSLELSIAEEMGKENVKSKVSNIERPVVSVDKNNTRVLAINVSTPINSQPISDLTQESRESSYI